MAILDSLLEFSDAQSLASQSDAAVVQSTNVVDLGAAGTDGWGTSLAPTLGGNLKMFVAVSGTLSASSATVIVKLMTHSAATSIKSGTELASILIPAKQAAGWRTSVGVPMRKTWARYLGYTYTITGAATGSSGNTVEAGLVLGDIDGQIVADV